MRALALVLVLASTGGGCSNPQSPADSAVADAALRDSGPQAPDHAGGPDPLSDAELWRVVSKLASDELQGRDEGTPGGAAARAFIIEELERCGVAPATAAGYEQRVSAGKGTNVLGLVKGTASPRSVVLSAHYDHLGDCGGAICNGAYDNAAGVALVLGAACALAHQPARRSVLVALWDAEEPPTFLTSAMGSEFYAANPVLPLAETDAAIVLDLLGSDVWPGAGLHFVLGGELSPEVASAVGRAQAPTGLKPLRLGLHLVELLPTGGAPQPWSDYDAFRDRGVPVLFLSDGYNKRYHKQSDEVDKLVRGKLPLEASYLLSVVRAVADAGHEKTTFDPLGADYVLDAASVEETLAGAVAPGGLGDQLSSASKSKMKDDLAKVQQVKAKLAGGTPPAAAEITTLRSAVQRVMCYTSPQYTELLCNLF